MRHHHNEQITFYGELQISVEFPTLCFEGVCMDDNFKKRYLRTWCTFLNYGHTNSTLHTCTKKHYVMSHIDNFSIDYVSLNCELKGPNHDGWRWRAVLIFTGFLPNQGNQGILF